MGFTGFLAQTFPCFQYTFNPLLGNTLSSLSLLQSDMIPVHPFLQLFHFQHFTLSICLHLSTLLLGHTSPFKLPSRGQLLPGEAQKLHGEGGVRVTESASCPAHSNMPAHLSNPCTNLRDYSPNLGTHVKKHRFLLESTKGKTSQKSNLKQPG